jgi:protein TonB
MGDARSRLLFALAASCALHLALIYGVTVRAPPPPASPVIARLQYPAPGAPPVAPKLPPRPSPVPAAAARAEHRSAPAHPEIGGTQPPPVLPAAAAVPPPPDSPLPSVAMPLLADPTWYRAQDLDLYPRALGPVAPAYPMQARQEGIGGEVTLVLKVDEHGAVQDIAVVQAAPEGYFEAAAMAALQAARFTPAERDGRSVRSEVVVRVSFDPRQAR